MSHAFFGFVYEQVFVWIALFNIQCLYTMDVLRLSIIYLLEYQVNK